MKIKGPIIAMMCCCLVCYGCSLMEATGEAVGVVGKVGWVAVKAVGDAAYTGTSMAGQTANQTNKTLSRTSSRRDTGISVSGQDTEVALEREGKSYYVRAKVNGIVYGKFLLDTGASAVQISNTMARRLRLDKKKSQAIPVTLAGGQVVAGRMVTLDEVKLGALSANNVKAIILDYEQKQESDGLLGMSFLENFVFQIDTQKSVLKLNKR